MVVSKLPQTEFGPNDHREDAPDFNEPVYLRLSKKAAAAKGKVQKKYAYEPSVNAAPAAKQIKSNILDEFHFRWLNIEGIDTSFPISLVLF